MKQDRAEADYDAKDDQNDACRDCGDPARWKHLFGENNQRQEKHPGEAYNARGREDGAERPAATEAVGAVPQPHRPRSGLPHRSNPGNVWSWQVQTGTPGVSAVRSLSGAKQRLSK